MIYESETGESFRMSCGTRNDHKLIGQQPAETFDDCMDICGKVLVSIENFLFSVVWIADN
jgi:hypothetical protein